MRKIFYFISIGFIAIALLNTSCSIEKRHYMAGYNVEWKSNKNLTANYENKTTQPVAVNNEKKSNVEQQNSSIEPVFHQAVAEKSMKNEIPEFAYATNVKKSETGSSHEVLSTISKAQLVSTISAAKKAMALMAQSQRRRAGVGVQIVALILCFFLGFLGIHSFYLGNRTKGIIQLILFLAGLVLVWVGIGLYLLYALGVWVIIDFIRILIGDLGPGW